MSSTSVRQFSDRPYLELTTVTIGYRRVNYRLLSHLFAIRVTGQHAAPFEAGPRRK